MPTKWTTDVPADTDGNVPVSLSATPTIDIGDVTLLAGTALIGKVGIDQVTANANEVVLKAGTALAGKVGIDQTTDGTTNAVNLKTSSGAGATIGATNGAAVVTDADGTLQQYLRGVVKLIAAIISVKIDQTTPGTTNKVTTDVVTATPTIYNVTLTNANTEYSQALPANCRGFEFQCRTGVTCRWSNVTGKVATPTAPYMTLQPNAFYSSPPINQGASPSTIYLASASAGAIIELIAYT